MHEDGTTRAGDGKPYRPRALSRSHPGNVRSRNAVVAKCSCRRWCPITYLVEPCLLVADVSSNGGMSPDETIIRLAVESVLDDGFSDIGAHSVSGHNSRAVPFDT